MIIQNDFNLYFKIADTEKELKSCQSIRYKVYCEERKWLPAEHYPDELERDIFDEDSPTFIALNDDFDVVGMMRILKGSFYDTLPFLQHPSLQKRHIDIRTMAELSRYIVIASRNRSLISHGIFRLSHHYCKRNGITDYVILIEPSLRRLIERFYWFYEPMCTPAMYFGAFTYPAICNVKKIEKIWYNRYPENYKFYMEESNVISSVEMVK
ncbi:MAG: GNAT family N-acetyltransferase [Bacteroidales bacterium]|nr:GNAT family N-acetyltransferase [Bacteroidales bacterium]